MLLVFVVPGHVILNDRARAGEASLRLGTAFIPKRTMTTELLELKTRNVLSVKRMFIASNAP